uniref:Uncharacterized protein n=1 Tax=Octopus bimaculoides TaxID=37653 RepID=A0A0L8GXL0_OCTBM
MREGLCKSSTKKTIALEDNESICQLNISGTYWKDYAEQQCQDLTEAKRENNALYMRKRKNEKPNLKN